MGVEPIAFDTGGEANADFGGDQRSPSDSPGGLRAGPARSISSAALWRMTYAETSMATRGKLSLPMTPLTGAMVAPAPEARCTSGDPASRDAERRDRDSPARMARRKSATIADGAFGLLTLRFGIRIPKSRDQSSRSPRRPLHMRRDGPPVVDRRQQIRRRRRRARRQKCRSAEQRAGLRDLARAAGGDQHSREPRMKRQALHAGPPIGQLSATRQDPAARAASARRPARLRAAVRTIRAPRIAAPRDHVEHGGAQIDAVNLRLAMRPQPIARIPQAPHDARRDAPRAARALIRRILR